MKERTKRGLSMLLAFVMCLSLLSGLTFAADAATVNYVTGNVSSKYTNVIKNWGSRGTTATFLSPNAEAFYEDNNTSYETLSSYSGASSISAVPKSALYGELKELMVSNHDKITSYDETKEMYAFTDCQNSGNPSTISAFYSGTAIGPAWNGGWNREHVWPNSKGLGGSDENDIMMLRPTTTSENSSRGNTAYGEGSGFHDPNKVSNGKYNLHGDVARIALYVYVRWGNTSYMWGSGGEFESKEVLLKWMEEDPVDTWELGRNDAVESITGTRNVFVDYPELAFLLFDEEIPADMPTPSGEAANPGYTITATVNNAAYGSVSVSGRTINAVPAAGYQVAGYTVVSGSAAVTQNGNAFTVSATSDCTIRINFEARTPAAVNFYENGSKVSSPAVYLDDVIAMPAHSGTVPTGYRFVGWVTERLSETTTQPATLYTLGRSYTVTGAVDFHALYSRVDSEGTATASVFSLYSGELTEGDYLVVFDGAAMKAQVTSNRLSYTAVTIEEASVTNPDANLIWHIAPTSDGYWTIYNESTSSYAGGTGTKSQAALLESVTDFAKWTASGTEVYDFVNRGNAAENVNASLRKNTTFGFACYADAFSEHLDLYKAVTGTVYYSTDAEVCDHGNTKNVAEQAATCTEPGYTAGVYCSDCGSYISGHAVIEALGHDYSAAVTPPTVTEQGYTTYTCATCGDSYKDDYTDALGETHTVSFAVPEGVAAVANMSGDASGITLPEAGVPAGEYTFAGWAEAAVEDTKTAPTLYAAGDTYSVKENTVLYAVYTYMVNDGASTAYQLVTSSSQLVVGSKVVIAAADYDFALSTNQKSNNRDAVEITKSGNTISINSDVAQLVLGEGTTSGTYSFYCNAKSGYLYAANSKSNYLRTKAGLDDNGSFKITVEADGTVTVVAQGSNTRNTLRFNNGAGNELFSCYAGDSTSTQVKPISLYIEAASGTTYYTSAGAEVAPALFDLAGANLELANDITMYFYVYAKDVADGYYMEIVKTNADGSKVTKQVAKTDWAPYGNTMYYVGFNGMAAKEMADEISVTVYNAEGTQVSNTTVASISSYALKALDNAAYASMHTLMADLLNYGAAAQTFFKYNTSNLANAAMTETHKGYATKGFDMSKYTNDVVAGPGAVGANLALETNILQNFFFDPAVVDSTMTAKVSYTNFKGVKKTAEISGSEFGTMAGYGYVIVEVSVLVPADVMSLVSVEIVDASGNVVASVSDSISSYAVRANTSSPNALYIELMEYCLSCESYFG